MNELKDKISRLDRAKVKFYSHPKAEADERECVELPSVLDLFRCPSCFGVGKKPVKIPTIIGRFVEPTFEECGDCQGSGERFVIADRKKLRNQIEDLFKDWKTNKPEAVAVLKCVEYRVLRILGIPLIKKETAP